MKLFIFKRFSQLFKTDGIQGFQFGNQNKTPRDQCLATIVHRASEMVAQCYQACFCSLNTVFIVKLISNYVLNHNFTIKTGNSVVKISYNHKFF